MLQAEDDIERSMDYLEDISIGKTAKHSHSSQTSRPKGAKRLRSNLAKNPDNSNELKTCKSRKAPSALIHSSNRWSDIQLCSSKYDFKLPAFFMWMVLCLPGNVATFYLTLFDTTTAATTLNGNVTKLECQELKEDWKEIVSWSQYIIQGIGVSVISLFGLCANILSIVILLRCQNNRNFHRLLIGLAIVDILLVLDLAISTSLFGVFVKSEPRWYVLAYPLIIHPGRGIIRTSAIYMVVAVSTERYRYVAKRISKMLLSGSFGNLFN